jgi:hypothetical protein
MTKLSNGDGGKAVKRVGMIICFLVLIGIHAANPVFAQGKDSVEATDDSVAKLIGNWSGESICVDKIRFPACHDEQVIYRITKAAGKPETLIIKMDKLVDGKPETMDVFDFKYDAQSQTLVAEFTRRGRRGVWKFTVRDDVIEGSLVALPDKADARRVKVKRDK